MSRKGRQRPYLWRAAKAAAAKANVSKQQIHRPPAPRRGGGQIGGRHV